MDGIIKVTGYCSEKALFIMVDKIENIGQPQLGGAGCCIIFTGSNYIHVTETQEEVVKKICNAYDCLHGFLGGGISTLKQTLGIVEETKSD